MLGIQAPSPAPGGSSTATAKAPGPTSPLLLLPAELRNRFYNCVLSDRYIYFYEVLPYSVVPPDPRLPYHSKVYPSSSVSSWPFEPHFTEYENQTKSESPSNTFDLIKVCRQVHTETRDLVLASNIVDFVSGDSVIDLWLAGAPASMIGAVQTLRLPVTGNLGGFHCEECNGYMVSKLKEFPGLKKVEVVIFACVRDEDSEKQMERWLRDICGEELVVLFLRDWAREVFSDC